MRTVRPPSSRRTVSTDDGLAHQGVVPRQGFAHRFAVRLPQLRAALDVSEQKVDRARGHMVRLDVKGIEVFGNGPIGLRILRIASGLRKNQRMSSPYAHE